MKKYIYLSLFVIHSFACASEPENEGVEERRVIPRSLSDSNLILGEYIFLRSTFPNDYCHFVKFFSDPECIKYWGSGDTETEIEVKEDFKRASEETAKQCPCNYHWTVCSHDGVVGKIALYDLYGEKEEKAEIAYYTLPKYQGRKYTIHAGNLALSFAYNHWGR